jgi:hypothetical protein
LASKTSLKASFYLDLAKFQTVLSMSFALVNPFHTPNKSNSGVFSPTFYKRLNRTKVFFNSFFWSYIFGSRKIGTKIVNKMLVKLTPDCPCTRKQESELLDTTFLLTLRFIDSTQKTSLSVTQSNKEVSITPTFYEQLFGTKVIFALEVLGL